MLPPYKGEDVTLFRGATFREWEAKTFGMSWTPDRQFGELHAQKSAGFSGLDGALFETFAPARAVISMVEPTHDRLEEREFFVDRRRLAEVPLLKRFKLKAD